MWMEVGDRRARWALGNNHPSLPPTIGSIVHVMLEERCHAAIVSDVQDRDVIAATVFRPLVSPLAVMGLHQSGAGIHLTWHWPTDCYTPHALKP